MASRPCNNARSDRESRRVSCGRPLENEGGHAHKIKRDVRRPQHFAIRVPFGDRARSWAIGNGPTTRFLTPTPALAPQSACHPRTLGTAPAEICLFRRSVIAIPLRNNPLWATHNVRVRGGATPPAAGSRAPTSCRCRPLRRRRSPSLVRLITTALYPAHNDDRPFESGTSRGQRPVSAMSLLTHPTMSPVLRSLVNEISRCRAFPGSAFGSTHEGGATPPAVGNVDPRLVDVCPLRGRRSPSQQFALGE